MVLLTEKCVQLLKCRVSELRDRLNHPEDRERLIQALNGRRVQTTYNDRNGYTKTFTFGGITAQGAATTMAYGRLGRPFNVNVAAHFYVRHRIKLRHPFLHCVIERFPEGQEDRLYPLELCKIEDEEQKVPNWLGNVFSEIRDANNRGDTNEDGRAECSQPSDNSSSYSIW
ncbi:hypothetical protein GPALN_013203 [Globodera pallida]|nr:hypothetical protein GPALN_013203 [Globodera pallida]